MRHYDLFSPSSIFTDFNKVLSNFDTQAISKSSAWNPTTNVSEKDNFYHLSLDVPGVEQNNITIDIKENILTLKGERKDRFKNDEGEFETVASFTKSFQIPKDTNLDELDANLDHGVLDIVIPKLRPVEPVAKTIQVGIGRSKLLS